jgi:hypothetical protein
MGAELPGQFNCDKIMQPKVTKIQTVFSLAVLVLIGLAEMQTHFALNVRQPVGLVLCAALWLAGLLIWWKNSIPPYEIIPPVFQGEPIPQDPPPPVYKTLKDWGLMLFLSASILSAVSAYRFPPTAPPAQNFSPVLQAKPPFKFPLVELKILILDGARSTVLLNGEVLRVGESAGGIRVVSLDGRYVTLESGGHTNVVFVPK